MNSFLKSLFLIPFLLLSCQQHIKKSNDQSLKTVDSTKTTSFDSIEAAIETEKLFYTTIIRLHPNDSAFIYIDADYVDDKTAKLLFQNTDYLTPENREAFYQKIIASLPKEDLHIHDLIWSLKEVRGQISGNGGFHTLLTWMTQKPTKADPFYYIEVRRLYPERLGTCTAIGFVKIKAKTNEIFVMDEEGIYYPLTKWRQLKKL
ncbi:hypothetical protein [Flavobacterium cerinum]|uniref:SnoaL-like domain-containing protein n=1 Tax=Flavobacterium cerinum TaxID=2502784 RepID=A0ABY5IT09_9FLAO|nr:hypothetical protein [Flavobacterium cerinum]UUC44601.1 hypothetical protein NOX80_13280 [Flavobacterium cerinum]